MTRTGSLTVAGQRVTIIQAPQIASVSAAGFAVGAVASESIVAAFGAGLAKTTEVANTQPLPTMLAGATVIARDSAGQERLAPLFFVSPAQINFLIPQGTATGNLIVTVINENETVAAGNHQIEFDQAQDRFVAAPVDLGPASDQVFLVLFGTGLRFRSALSGVNCTIGGVSSEVLFAAAAPGFVGLDQVNVRLPRILVGRGEVDVVLSVDGQAANTVRVSTR